MVPAAFGVYLMNIESKKYRVATSNLNPGKVEIYHKHSGGFCFVPRASLPSLAALAACHEIRFNQLVSEAMEGVAA